MNRFFGADLYPSKCGIQKYRKEAEEKILQPLFKSPSPYANVNLMTLELSFLLFWILRMVNLTVLYKSLCNHDAFFTVGVT